MTDTMGFTDQSVTDTTIPIEGQRLNLTGAGALPTERAAAVMVLGALVFCMFLRGAFKGALGD